MKRLNGWALVDMTPFLAMLAAAGIWIAASEFDSGRSEARAPDLSNLSVGVKTPHMRYRFTEDDIAPVVTAMSNAGISDFVCYINPSTGAIDVVTGFDHKPHLDIKPGSCPNPVNVDHGFAAAIVPASLLGNAFDVTQVDITTVRVSPVLLQLGGDVELPPVHISYEDVGAPFEGTNCDCGTLGPDGILDLVIHFDRAAMTNGWGLDSVPNNTAFPLKVTGLLNEGRGVFGTRDCIKIINH
jgi:hypothetical protein